MGHVTGHPGVSIMSLGIGGWSNAHSRPSVKNVKWSIQCLKTLYRSTQAGLSSDFSADGFIFYFYFFYT